MLLSFPWNSRPLASSSTRGLLALTLLFISAITASAAVTYRYTTSSNRIYIEDDAPPSGATVTLKDLHDYIVANSKSWGFTLNETDKAWECTATIYVEDNVTLLIKPELVGVDTISTLRLKGDATENVGVVADGANLVVGAIAPANTMVITSWDFDSSTPAVDTNLNDGRPFISALSSNSANSNLSLVNASLEYLGWNTPEQCAANWVVVRNSTGTFSSQSITNCTFTECFFNARDLPRTETVFLANTFTDCVMGDYDVANIGTNTVTNPTIAAIRARVSWVTSSMRIYLNGPGASDPSYIRFYMGRNYPTSSDPNDLLEEVSANTWLLRAELRIEDGARFNLHGSAIGGDCDEFRLRSNGDTSESDFTVIRADYGHIDMRNTLVTSWDENENDFDYTPNQSSFDASTLETVSGDPEYRAHIWVVSRKPSGGVTWESRMDIIDSTVQYLGYQGGKAYGLTWKVEDFAGQEPVVDSSGDPTFVAHPGCGPSPKVKEASVWGDITGSTLQYLHFAVYTFGHGSMSEQTQWTNNTVAYSNVYGFDPHDDSDNLLIEGNTVHHNGKHGIIASKFCDNVIIRNNYSHSNGENGIMIHDGSNDALVENNQCDDNEDSGIAIFDSCRAIVRNNTATGNFGSGIRLSVGSSHNLIENNVFVGHPDGPDGPEDKNNYGVFMYEGTDVGQYSDPNKVNTNNVFRNNSFTDFRNDGIKMQNSLNNLFESNTFTNISTGDSDPTFRFEVSQNTLLRKNIFPADSVVKVRDFHVVSGNGPSSVILSEQVGSVDVDFTGQPSFTWDPGSLDTTTNPRTFSVLVDDPNNGHVVASPKIWVPVGSLHRRFITRSDVIGQDLDFEVGDLLPSTAFDIYRDGALIQTSATSNASGVVAFSDTSVSAATTTYELLVSGSSGYATWAAAAIPSGSPNGFSDDADDDGEINGAEYGLGSNPGVSDTNSVRVPTIVNGSSATEVSFGITNATDLRWIVYRSPTLGPAAVWTEIYRRSGTTETFGSVDITSSLGANNILTVSDAASVTPRTFYQVEYELLP